MIVCLGDVGKKIGCMSEYLSKYQFCPEPEICEYECILWWITITIFSYKFRWVTIVQTTFCRYKILGFFCSFASEFWKHYAYVSKRYRESDNISGEWKCLMEQDSYDNNYSDNYDAWVIIR